MSRLDLINAVLVAGAPFALIAGIKVFAVWSVTSDAAKPGQHPSAKRGHQQVAQAEHDHREAQRKSRQGYANQRKVLHQ